MKSYEEEYNHLLQRYLKGCKYLAEHGDEHEKLMPELLKILDKMNKILDENKITNTDDILNGFGSQKGGV